MGESLTFGMIIIAVWQPASTPGGKGASSSARNELKGKGLTFGNDYDRRLAAGVYTHARGFV